jgi:hypothetical protein
MFFECIDVIDKSNTIPWKGRIINLIKYESHFEMKLQGRAIINVIFGKTNYGGFVCIPDLGVGCPTANFKDKFWNFESLHRVLEKEDAITVACALHGVADILD